ncbi:MAG: glutaredoxin 3 [Myxococcota bacterium]
MQQSSSTKSVTVYTTSVCPYCKAAKQLLEQEGIAYEEKDVTGQDDKRAWLLEKTGRRTVPQIFFGEESVGGYDDLAALKQAGQLHQRLR